MRSAGFAEKMSRRGALWAALLLLAAPVGCGAPDAQDDGAAQTALESLGGYLGADGRSGCTVDLDGGDRVCRSESEWQKVAELACPAHGLSLVAFKTFTDCGLGKHRNVAYACCPAATPTPPPPPPPAMCTTNKSSDPNVCLDLTAWKTKAAATCALNKQELGQFTLSSPCGMGSFSQIEFSCCPGQNPPPQPSCMTTKLGGANSCIDLSAWKTKATAYCSAAMLTLGGGLRVAFGADVPVALGGTGTATTEKPAAGSPILTFVTYTSSLPPSSLPATSRLSSWWLDCSAQPRASTIACTPPWKQRRHSAIPPIRSCPRPPSPAPPRRNPRRTPMPRP